MTQSHADECGGSMTVEKTQALKAADLCLNTGSFNSCVTLGKFLSSNFSPIKGDGRIKCNSYDLKIKWYNAVVFKNLLPKILFIN